MLLVYNCMSASSFQHAGMMRTCEKLGLFSLGPCQSQALVCQFYRFNQHFVAGRIVIGIVNLDRESVLQGPGDDRLVQLVQQVDDDILALNLVELRLVPPVKQPRFSVTLPYFFSPGILIAEYTLLLPSRYSMTWFSTDRPETSENGTESLSSLLHLTSK